VRGGQVPGVIMHTGQGSEYTAGLVRQACVRLGISQSMGRPYRLGRPDKTAVPVAPRSGATGTSCPTAINHAF